MTKKQKILFGVAVAAAWVIVLTLAAIFVLPAVLEHFGKPEQPPEEVMQTVFEALQEDGTEEPVLFGVDGTPVGISAGTGLAGMIMSQLEYELVALETEEETATASLRITAPDTLALVQQALEGMESYDEAAFTERMEQLLKENPQTKTFDVEVEMVVVEKRWCLVTNPAFSDAITGGLISRYQQVQQAIIDAMAGGEAQ